MTLFKNSRPLGSFSEIRKQAVDLAHTPLGNYLLDSCEYGGPIARSSNVFTTCFEESICEVLDWAAQSAKVFVDIGANIGYHSVRISPFVDAVYAIEPSNPLSELLKINAKLCDIRNISAYQYALSDRNGEFLGSTDGPLWTHANDRASVITFDTFAAKVVFPHGPYLIKIDVDGYEGKVIEGMASFLAENGNWTEIIVEITPSLMAKFGSSPETLFKILEGIGYRVYQIDTHFGGVVRELNSPADICGKEANCLVTKNGPANVHSPYLFCNKKRRIVNAIDSEEPYEKVLEQIRTMQNPIFEDQYLRFLAITRGVVLPSEIDAGVLANFPAYLLRKGWTAYFQEEIDSARAYFDQTKKEGNAFFNDLAQVGLLRLERRGWNRPKRSWRQTLSHVMKGKSPLLDPDKSIAIQARLLDPLYFWRKNHLYYLFQ